MQVEDRRAARLDFGPSKLRGEPAVLPERRAASVVTVWIAQNYVRRQVLVDGAQGVADPRTKRRPSGKDFARIQAAQPLRMVVVVADHRPHEAQLVGDRTDVRQKFAQLHPALAMRTEAKRRTHQQIGLAAGLKTLNSLGMLLAASLCKFGFWVEQVDLART